VSLQRRVAWEARFGDGLFLATILWIVFGALPTIGLLVGQLVTGGFVKSGDVPASFPAFMPPWWAAYP
jgi:sugar phosphate permease